MKRPGIKELAKLLSLNPSTVSRALADHPDIKPETKERVKAAAIEFNYQPNLHARFFRKKSSELIAVILPSYNMFFVPSLIEAIDSSLKKEGYGMITFFIGNDDKNKKQVVDHCLSWLVDGVLIALPDADTSYLKRLTEAEIPFIIMDRSFDITDDFSIVTIDHFQAAYDATAYLIKNDKTNILGIFESAEQYITQERLNGFKKCLNDYDIGYSEYDIIYHDKGFKNIETKLRNTPYNGVFIMSDELLLTTYPILLKNRQIPGQISLIAISDGVLPHQLYPKISYIRNSGHEMGTTATSTLLKQIKSKNFISENVLVSANLIDLE